MVVLRQYFSIVATTKNGLEKYEYQQKSTVNHLLSRSACGKRIEMWLLSEGQCRDSWDENCKPIQINFISTPIKMYIYVLIWKLSVIWKKTHSFHSIVSLIKSTKKSTQIHTCTNLIKMPWYEIIVHLANQEVENEMTSSSF